MERNAIEMREKKMKFMKKAMLWEVHLQYGMQIFGFDKKNVP